MPDELTPRQADVGRAIVRLQSRYGRLPSITQVASVLGISPQVTARHAHALIEKGFLAPGPGGRPLSGYRLRDRAMAAFGVGYPRLGSIPAGPLADALGETDEIDIATSIEDLIPVLRPGDFRLRIDGDSMDLAGLPDGADAFFRPDVQPSSGQICAVYVEGEGGTVKRVFDLGTKVRLEPHSSNPVHRPATHPADQVLIQGVLKAVHQVRLF